MELCRNLTHSLCDYERKNRGGLSELQAIVMRQTKSLLFKVLVKNSYGKLFNKNYPIKIRFVRTIDKALINKNKYK